MGTDPQQQRVYDAEQALRAVLDSGIDNFDFYGQVLPVEQTEKHFGSIEAVQAYVDAVLALNWVRELSHHATTPVKVRERKGRTKAHYTPWSATIAVPDHLDGARFSWAMRELVVLHELAHHLTRWDDEAHGAEFTGTFLYLVKHLIGDTSHLVLMAALNESGVKFKHFA